MQLHDLRVFDSTGAALPFALTQLEPPAIVRLSSVPVAVFPVHGPAREAGRIHDGLQIRTGNDGALISVTAPARTADDELLSLVLDLRPAAQAAKVGAAAPVGALTLMPPPGMRDYDARVILEVSDDLQSWDEWASGNCHPAGAARCRQP